jgi:hypothetical protein
VKQERKGLRFPFTPLFPFVGRIAAELDQPSLFRVKFQTELCQPIPELIQEPDGLRSMLKTQHESSRPGELHPQALTDPDLSVSAHPALTVQPRPASIGQCANKVGSRDTTLVTH